MKRMMKTLGLRILGEKNVGRLDYLLNRKSKDSWGPLNGQKIRQGVYADILKRIGFKAIVETGTYRGTTSDYFAASGLPVYTVELHPRMYGYSMQRFSKDSRVHVYQGDSPVFLRKLAADPNMPKSKVFFYLDAHVQDSSRYFKAPLVEELEIIFSAWSEAVVMVDDFEVPEMGYGFDNWGDERNLSVSCLRPLKNLKLSAFFPSVEAKLDTGASRGWIVLCREESVVKTLAGIQNLRSYVLQ